MGYSDPTGPRPGRIVEGTALATITDVTPRFSYEGPAATAAEPQDSGGLEIWKLLGALFRRKFLILAIVVLGVAISAILTLRDTPLYRAFVTLEVQARETQIIQGASLEPAAVADTEFIGTQVALLTSRALAERVAENLKLTGEPAYANQNASPDIRLRQAASAILGGLEVAPERAARVIDVSFVSTRPEETARIANAVAENFIEMNLERRYSATAYARRFLEERLAVTKTALEDTERKLVQYSRDKKILDLTAAGGADVGKSLDASALVSLSASLTEAQNQRILVEQRYREAADNPSTREMLESPTIQTLRQTRSQLLTDYQTKLSMFLPDHPEMVEIKSRIAAIERQMDNERINIVKALEAEYRAAVAREDQLSNRVEQLKDQVQGLRDRSIDYNILNRDADTLRAQYDALLQRLKEITITSGVGTSQVSILDRAERPGLPFKPDVVSSILRALGLSIALAVALALFVEFLDDRIKTPEDVTSKLGIRLIGVIPRVPARQSISKLLRNPRARVTEAFSSARANLQFAIIAGSMKTLLVTGSKPNEGKTTLALALASSFAATGKKVLIIDADLRRPSFAFDAKASAGLSGVLLEGLPPAAQIVPGPTPNLDLLPSGAVPHNPAELLAGTRLVQLIEDVGQRYDLIFIDSPPVLAFADAPILSSVCDGTIVVVQSGAVFRQAVRRALERLYAARATIAGAVLTKFDARKAGYGEGYGYGYGGYGERAYRKIAAAPSNKRRIRHFSETSEKQFETGEKLAETDQKQPGNLVD